MIFNVRHHITIFKFIAASAVGIFLPDSVIAQHSLLPSHSDLVAEEAVGQSVGAGVTLQQQIDATPISYSQPMYSGTSLFGSSSRNGLQPKGTWALTAEAVFADFDDVDELVGSSTAPQAIGPYSAVSLGAIDGDQVGPTTLVPGLIGQRSSDDIAAGWRAALEFRNLNDGGFQIEGMMVRSGDQSWQRGVGGMNAGADLTTVRVGAALPLSVPGGTGYAIPYDQFFKVELDTSVDSISAMFAPAGYYSGSIRFQPTMGFRYLRVDQELNFAGAGSGQLWAPNADGTRDPATAATTISAPYQSVLKSSSETNLFGPVVGVNATTTGRLVRLNGLFRAGLMFADEDLSLSGRGLGRATDVGFNPLTPFNDSRSTTTPTFLLESQLGVDLHIFQLINKLRGQKFASSLVLRLGWSIIYLDEIVKPQDAVRWNGFPSSPTVRRQSSQFTMDSFNVGLVLKY